MAGDQSAGPASGGYAAPASSKQAAARAELQKGSALHKQGALSEAATHYVAALDALDIQWRQVDAQRGLKDVPRDAAASDAMHWFGALRVQQLAKECEDAGEEEDEEDPSPCSPVSPASTRMPRQPLGPERIAELEKWLRLLRAAASALPEGSEGAKRARALNSIGTALLLLGPTGLSEAASVLREAVRLAPSSWPVRSNLLKALRRKAKGAKPNEESALEREAAASLEEMAKLRPGHPGIFYRLGMSLKHIGRTADAIAALERHLEAADAAEAAANQSKSQLPGAFVQWKTAHARHWLAVMKGDNTATAPPEYVASLFDGYADHFEEHLVEKLQYNTPALLADDIRKLDAAVDSWRRCADLGCGTGLMGPPLRRLGFRGRLEGVDLSELMLVEALKKGGPGEGYERLLCGDILDIFAQLPQEEASNVPVRVERVGEGAIRTECPPDESSRFELVVASDVFVYVGDLQPTFTTVAQWMTPGGVFAFSTESLDTQDGVPYKLNPTGRYTHAPSYIRDLALASGFEACSCRAVMLRMNAGKPVNGHCHVLRQPS